MNELEQPKKRTLPQRRKDQRVARFRRALLKVAPHLDDPRFGALVHSFSRANLLLLDSYEFLQTHGLVGEDGELRSSIEKVTRLMALQLKYAAALNLSPASLNKLQGGKPADLAAAFAEHVEEAVIADDKQSE